MKEKLIRYLEWAHFNSIRNPTPKYKIPLLANFLAAFSYTIISIVLICKQEASIIVYGLNILCLFRTLISNIINASKVTDSGTGAKICEKHEGNSHYHLKVCFLGAIFFVATILLLLLINEPSAPIIKTFASICVAIVFIDDCEDVIVCAYGAEIIVKGGDTT